MSTADAPVTTLRSVLRAAAAGKLGAGWIYLQDGAALSPDILVYLASDTEEDFDEHGRSTSAVVAGFPVEGLERGQLEDCADWCRQFEDPPRDELLLESFVFYWRFDAFLPHPGAGDPPPWEETQAQLDREFCDGLGDERPGTHCTRPGCQSGTVPFSALCRAHHFEMIHNRPYPFRSG